MNEFGVTYENLRGTNYSINSSLQLQTDFALLSYVAVPVPGDIDTNTRVGTYSAANIDSELAFLASSGFNNLRVMLPFFNWVIDKAQFRRNLKHFIGLCRRHELTVTWVLWNAIGNGINWDTVDVAELLQQWPNTPTNDLLHRDLLALSRLFQVQYGQFVPKGKPWHLTGYPGPGNNLLRRSGRPENWNKSLMDVRVTEYLDDVMDVFDSQDGRATMFLIDVANEFDGVAIPLEHTIEFVSWNHDRIRSRLPEVPLTIGWAANDVEFYARYVIELANAGIELDRHSFHIYVEEPEDYAKALVPLFQTAARVKIPLMVTEFYRTDTAEWGHIDTALEFFKEHGIPTIMWGFINTNIYGDPNKPGNQGNSYLDGVVEARELEFDREYGFRELNDADYLAVLDYNRAGSLGLGI